MQKSSFRLLMAFCICMLLTSCASQSTTQGLHGKITLDGEPVETGRISFEPSENEKHSRQTGGVIRDGKYEIAEKNGLPAGKYLVKIYWPKKTDRKVKSPEPPGWMYVTKEAVPAKYNKQSTLSIKVEPGKREYDFELVSKSPT